MVVEAELEAAKELLLNVSVKERTLLKEKLEESSKYYKRCLGDILSNR